MENQSPADDVRALACPLLAEMLEIPSPSGSEGPLAQHLAERMDRLGFDARIDSAGNVIGEIGSTDAAAPQVMLLGHLDTIDRPLATRIEADRFHGRGAVDAKGPLAAMICAAARFAGMPYRVQVVGVVEEETPESRGATEILRWAPCPDAVVIGEPSGWDSVVIGYKGKLDLDLTLTRPPSHSSSPEEKATTALVAFWSALLEELGPQGVGFHLPSAALCALSGDMTQGSAQMSCRLPVGFDAPDFIQRLRRHAGEGRLEVRNCIDAVRVGRADPVVRALSAGIRGRGGVPVHRVRGGTSDMNTLRAQWDVPIATYGPGDSRLDHGDNEHILVEDYLRAIHVLADAVDELGREIAASTGGVLDAVGGAR